MNKENSERKLPCGTEDGFDANQKLKEQYIILGIELCEMEADLSFYISPSEFCRSRFRQGSVFVPTEVLEAYLEDLLSAGVPDARLGIATNRSITRNLLLLVGSVSFALLCGLYSASLGHSLIFAFALTAVLALPAVAALVFSPHLAISRRMKFARVVSAEIARRRGGDEQGRLKNLLSPKLLIPGFGQQSHGSPAKVIFH